MSHTPSSSSSGNTRPDNPMFEEDGILTTNIHEINSRCKISFSLLSMSKSKENARKKDDTDLVTLVSWFKLKRKKLCGLEFLI